MGQVLHPRARTTEVTRRKIQNSLESIAKLLIPAYKRTAKKLQEAYSKTLSKTGLFVCRFNS